MKSERPWIESPVEYVAALHENYKAEKPKDLLKLFTDAFVHRVSNTEVKLDLYPGTVTQEQQHGLNMDKLCVVRGLVQDIGDSELFVLSYATTGQNQENEGNNGSKQSTAFLRDNTVISEDCVLDQQSVTYADRQSLIVTPVPGENDWVLDELKSSFALKGVNSDEDFGEYSKAAKMRKCGEDSTGNGNAPNGVQKEIAVKFYGDETEVAINHVYMFYGVFETVPVATEESAEQYLMDCDNSNGSGNRDGSRAKLIFHSVFMRPVVAPGIAKLNADSLTAEDAIEQSCQLVSKNRPLLLAALRDNVFDGDENTAEWTLLHLVSSVYKRADTMPIGNLSLNITNCSKETVDRLHALLSNIVASVVRIPLTVEALNKSKLVPYKDVESGILHTGLLQLPPGTSIIIDETQMNPGQLDEVGLSNLAALTALIEHQKVYYDFKFQRVELLCNYNVIILSGTASLIKTSAEKIKLGAVRSQSDRTNHNMEDLVSLRRYLAAAKTLPYEVPAEISEVAQQYFVQSRQRNQKYSVENFHRLLNTARIITLSQGIFELNEESCQRAVELAQAQEQCNK